MRYLDQLMLDRKRRTYRLSFPIGTDATQVQNFIKSLSGMAPRSQINFFGLPSIVFELWVTDSGIEHRIKVPYPYLEYIMPQLAKSGFQVDKEITWHEIEWMHAVELGLDGTELPLAIDDIQDVSYRLLHSFRDRKPGEALLMQWVVTPAARSPKPIYGEAKTIQPIHRRANTRTATRDEVEGRRSKLDEPNFHATLRLASTASTPVRAAQLVHTVRHALNSVNGAHTWFRRRFVPPGDLQLRLDHAMSSMTKYGMRLSTSELTALIAWPIGNPAVPGLASYVGRRFPPSPSVQSQGLVIGEAKATGHERPVAIGIAESMMHIFVLGANGTGKTALLSHMARQVMEAGYGLIVLETAGNLSDQVINYVPESRIRDVVLFDASDDRYPVGFNILDQGYTPVMIKQVSRLLDHMYGAGNMGIWSKEYIKQGLRVIADVGGLTFIDILRLLNPMTPEEVVWVDGMARKIKDEDLRRWWQNHENHDKRDQVKRVDPILSRLYELGSPELRNIFGQSKSTFQVRDVLLENKILVVNLKGVDKDAAAFISALLMDLTWQVATTAIAKEVPTYILADEFGSMIDLPIDTETLLAQARKYKLPFILATQGMEQLKTNVKNAVVTNARNKIIFQTNASDGAMLGRESGNLFSDSDITTLPIHEAVATLQTPAGPSGPVSIKTYKPKRQASHSAEIIRTSQQTYGRAREDVELERRGRYSPEEKPATRKRKATGWDD